MYSSCSTPTLKNFNPVDLVFGQMFNILWFYIILRQSGDVLKELYNSIWKNSLYTVRLLQAVKKMSHRILIIITKFVIYEVYSWYPSYTRRHIQYNESIRIPRNTHNFLKVLKNSHVPGAISFSFASHWLQNRLLTVINLKTALHEWVQSCTPTSTIETTTHLVSLGSSYVVQYTCN